MATATVRIPAEKRDILRIIAGIERTEMKEILSELIDEYIERHQETLDLLCSTGLGRHHRPRQGRGRRGRAGQGSR